MESISESVIRSACRRLLRPIAAMILKCGMTWKEFSDLSKSVFVESASRDYGIRGRPTNVSRVSLLTGISRKEVKRQRDLLKAEAPIGGRKTTDATRLLSGWHQDPDYIDASHKPLILQEKGLVPSFEALCSRYGGDVPASTLCKELIKTGSIERMADGQLRAVRSYYQPAVHDDENLRWAMSLIEDLTETMNNNVFPDGSCVPRFGGSAENDRIPASAVPQFHEFLDQRGQALLEEIDDWLTKHVVADGAQPADRVRIGVGLFAIEDELTMERNK